MSDERYQRYVDINLPHARTVILRIGRTLEFLGALREHESAGAPAIQAAFGALEKTAQPFEEDPAMEAAIAGADSVAGSARTLVEAIEASGTRSDRLGQHVRNLFECLGLAVEGARLSVRCGERPDSPLR